MIDARATDDAGESPPPDSGPDGTREPAGSVQVDPWPRWILDSYERLTDEELLPRTGDDAADAAALMAAPRIVLCHNGGPEPTFTYANLAAARLWSFPIDHMVGMPSRLSAAPAEQGARAAVLAQAAERGLLRGYEGVRTARDGRRFRILDATVWTVLDEAGSPVGQAATFERWEPVDESVG